MNKQAKSKRQRWCTYHVFSEPFGVKHKPTRAALWADKRQLCHLRKQVLWERLAHAQHVLDLLGQGCVRVAAQHILDNGGDGQEGHVVVCRQPLAQR